MDETDNEHVEEIFERMRGEHRQSRRHIEKVSGVTTILLSLVMAIIFLVALGYSGNSLLIQVVSIVSLIVAVGLFARGLHFALIGRR